jgi:glutathione S-transferase
MVGDDRYRFYAAEISYFSAKVRPFLRYKEIPFEEIPPTGEAFRDVILPRTGLGFIPVVVTPDDETLQDTSEILDELERRFPEPPAYPPSPVQRVVSYLLEVYADEFMVLPAMHYRWSFPESEAKARNDFASFAGNRETAESFADRMKGSLPLLGVNPDTTGAIEEHLGELLAALSRHFESHDFLLGSRMSLADCALMGPLYPHLFLDAVPGRLLRESAPLVCHWIERMNAPKPGSGEFLAKDALAESLRPILELAGRDATDEPPRAVGMHTSTLRGVRFERYTSSYTQWMLQRPQDAYTALGDSERTAVDAALAGTGLEAMLTYRPRHRLGKRRFKLVFEG